jgi:hypothetical protein
MKCCTERNIKYVKIYNIQIKQISMWCVLTSQQQTYME